jgi:hypothetical protein
VPHAPTLRMGFFVFVTAIAFAVSRNLKFEIAVAITVAVKPRLA